MSEEYSVVPEDVVEIIPETGNQRKIIKGKYVDTKKADNTGDPVSHTAPLQSERTTLSHRVTPFGGKGKVGVIYPLSERFFRKRVDGKPVIDGTTWDDDKEVPPAQEGDYVERFPSHTQRVITKEGHEVIKAKGFTLTVKTAPNEGEGEAPKIAGDSEVVIESGGGTILKMTANGDVQIVLAVNAKIHLGGDNTGAKYWNGVVRADDLKLDPPPPYSPPAMTTLKIPFGGSKKVFAEK